MKSKDRLDDNAFGLSGGQQQRLVHCPRHCHRSRKSYCWTEPCSQLDPISTAKVEELIIELEKERYTIVIVTHNMQQAARVSDFTAYMYMGEMVEFGRYGTSVYQSAQKATEDYITGRYG